PRRIWVDPHSPAASRTLFIDSPHAFAVKTASGMQKLPAPESVTFTDVSLGFGSAPQPVVYATAEQGAFVSKDGGGTWRKLSLPGNGGELRAIATSLRHTETAYLSYIHLTLDGKEW